MTHGISAHMPTREQHLMTPQPMWQDWGNLVIAAMLFVSPWLLGTVVRTVASWNAWVVSAGMVFFTVRTLLPPPGAYTEHHARVGGRLAWWQKIIDGCAYVHIAREQLVVGAWLLVAPSILRFASVGAAAWPAWAAGAATVILAGWKLWDFRRSRIHLLA